MRTVLKYKWLVIAAWVIGLSLLVWTAPNMEALVREKGQISVPDGYPSKLASEILDRASKQGDAPNGSQTALVFHSEQKLTDRELVHVKRAVETLEANKNSLHITNITTHFKDKELKDTLVSEDGRTVLVALSVEIGDREPEEVRKALSKAIEHIPVTHYWTGGWIIDEDVVKSSQEGLKRTEWITVVFILTVLLAVFRSVISPFIPLLTVGVSYVTSSSIVAFLVKYLNFPLSTFTQIFLVVVLFGIGTDYCILLLSRFKEELQKAENVQEAVVATYRTGGKTVFFSALAVLIGFAAIGFSTFKLYQSATAVAVGVAVLLLALVTLVPTFMALLGRKLFWPSKKVLEHKDSKWWGWAGRMSLAHPLRALLLVAVVAVPFLLLYDGDVSFNSLDELGPKYDSVTGFNIIADSFGPGESLPATLVLEHDEKLDTPEYLALIEKITREVDKLDGIKQVRSATRPVGEAIDELNVSDQAQSLEEGLGEGRDGLDEISRGLMDASGALTDSLPEIEQATGGVGELITGTVELKRGVRELGNGLQQLEKGLRDGSVGAGQLKRGLEQAQTSAEKLASGSQQLINGYHALQGGLHQLSGHYRQIEQQLTATGQALQAVQSNLNRLASRYPELKQDPDFLQAFGTVEQLQDGVAKLQGGLKQLNGQLADVNGGLEKANKGLADVSTGQSELAKGMEQLVQGMSELKTGIDRAANGQSEVVRQLPQFYSGLDQLKGGQERLQQGFADMEGQLEALTEGLDKSVDGLEQVAEGLGEAGKYLKELAQTSDEEMAGWFVPQNVLKGDDFQRVFDTYMSKDRRIATFDVVFDASPYASQSLDQVDAIHEAVERATKGTKLANATFGITGVTSAYHDLNAISNQDYSRTVVIVLLCLTLILVVLFRSLVMPAYLIASLVLTYYTAMGVAEMVFVDLFGYPGLNWPVPFFSFVILVALGIDYSIFLMDRFNEYRGIAVAEGILTAMRKMGTVIISAVIILGGTFAAMLPSGVLSLMQIATVTIAGLLLYAGLFLPFFVPVMVRTFGQANWWPFNRGND